jgi:hypothetical protein
VTPTPDTLRKAWELALASFLDPASNPTAALLVIASVAVLLLILILFVSIPILVLSERRRARDEAPDDEEQRRAQKVVDRALMRRRGMLWGIALLLTLGVVLAVGLGYTSTDVFCSKCHYTKGQQQRDTPQHPTTPHEGPIDHLLRTALLLIIGRFIMSPSTLRQHKDGNRDQQDEDQ